MPMGGCCPAEMASWIVGGVIVNRARRGRACALALVLVALLGGCSAGGQSTRPLPPAATTPVALVSAYLAGAKAGDCSFTRALTQKHTWAWCDDPKLLDYRSVRAAQFRPASQAGVDEQCVPFEMDTHGSSDGSMPSGWQPWSLCLNHTDAGWRVYDQGQG
jgi:hypothetical protein